MTAVVPPPAMPVRRRRFASFTDAFVINGRFGWPILAAFLFVNAIVILNAVLHDPKFGYDASAHIKYATTLAKTGWLPTAKDTHEFFSPPLPYIPLALLWATLDASGRDVDVWALKSAQLIQVGYSLVLTFFLIKLARLVKNGGAFVPTAALLLLGMVPTYYRTFAMIRGEPLLAMLATLGTFMTLRTFALRRPSMRAGAVLGLTLGLAVLSRQWAFFLLPALGLVGLWRVIADRENRAATIRAGLMTLAVFAIVGLPFYVHLYREHGTPTAFNREPLESDAASPDRAKADLGTVLERIATRPIRDELIDHPTAIFYADIWGDYWQYYLIYAREPAGKTKFRYVKPVEIERKSKRWPEQSNLRSMPAYLGRVCAAGAVPSVLFAAGVVGGLLSGANAFRRRGDAIEKTVLPTISLGVLTTIAGYVWFVSSYPSDEGDTIKASYPLQMYGLLAVLGAATLAGLHRRLPIAGWVVVGLLTIVAIHNLPACITRYR